MIFPELEPCRTTYKNTFVADFYREVHTAFMSEYRTEFTAEYIDNFSADLENNFTNDFENDFANPYSPSTDSRSIMSDNTTATGRTRSSPSKYDQGAWRSLTAAESFGANRANVAPFKFTDDSLIPVPVLPHDALQISDGLDQTQKKRCFSLFRKKSKQEFVTKDITRAEYLKHYAKDDNGMYIGTEEPAHDCMLSHESDLKLYRAFKFRNEI